MLDAMNKMAELKFEAPLAQFEESDEWTKTMDDESPVQQAPAAAKHRGKQRGDAERLDNVPGGGCWAPQEPVGKSSPSPSSSSCTQCGANNNGGATAEVQIAAADADNFGETFSGSLEDLVHTFDDKITRCFCDYEESVEKLAPVQIRTQEEIMNECQ